jgi:hypothetical protein
MALAKRGRPKGSGNPEDESLLREAYRALLKREFPSRRAAATEYGKRLPGDPEVNRDRLYRKLRERWGELEAELGQEEGKRQTLDEEMESLASELAGANPGTKEEALYRYFRIFVENADVAVAVRDRLAADGLEILPNFSTHLDKIIVKIIEKERAAYESSPVGRYMKRQLAKKSQ